MSRKHNNQKGFTLIEIIMTIVVIGIVAVPLSLFIFENVKSTMQSEEYSLAINLARMDMERIYNTSYANIVSATFPGYQGYKFDVQRTVSFAAGSSISAESLKLVRVTVTDPGDSSPSITFVTYIARNVSYGL